MRVLVIGCGYVGLPFARECLQQGHQVSGLTRSVANAEALSREGITPVVADISRFADLARCDTSFDWIVNLVSSRRGGVEAYRTAYFEGTRNIIEWLRLHPPRLLIAASSTSVYAQTDGASVDESSPTEPSSETGRILVETEELLIRAATAGNFPSLRLRIAGIYGPGRLHLIEQFKQPELAPNSPPNAIINMIHRDDVIGAIFAALAKGKAGHVYNVVDDEPVAREKLFGWLAERIERSAAGPERATTSRSSKRAFASKRVRNHRLKSELGYRLRFPTFREGFAGELLRMLAEAKNSRAI